MNLIHSDEGLIIETTTFAFLYGGQVSLSTQLVNSNLFHFPTVSLETNTLKNKHTSSGKHGGKFEDLQELHCNGLSLCFFKTREEKYWSGEMTFLIAIVDSVVQSSER